MSTNPIRPDSGANTPNPNHTHYCPDCMQIVPLSITPQGNHQRGSCSLCGRWLKWVPHEINPGDEKMYFGKHAGQLYRDIPVDYLRWVLDNCEHKLSARQRSNLIAYLREAGNGNH